jgi:hypothetical protein
MATITVPGMFLTGDHASRPAATAVGSGSIYSCTTDSLIYQSDGATWTTWATLGTGGAIVDPMTTRGDMIVRNASNVTARLGRGTASQVLTSDGTDLLWDDVTSGITDIDALPTAETDDTLRLAPDGVGGVEWASAGGGGGGWELLDEDILGSAAADITITAIAGGYRALRIVVLAKCAVTGVEFAALSMQVGDGSIDTGSNYGGFRTTFYDSGILYARVNAGTAAHAGYIPSNSVNADEFGVVIIDFPEYANTGFRKKWLGHSYMDGTSETYMTQFGGSWRNTAGQVDQVKVFVTGQNLMTGSRMTIYGLA